MENIEQIFRWDPHWTADSNFILRKIGPQLLVYTRAEPTKREICFKYFCWIIFYKKCATFTIFFTKFLKSASYKMLFIVAYKEKVENMTRAAVAPGKPPYKVAVFGPPTSKSPAFVRIYKLPELKEKLANKAWLS